MPYFFIREKSVSQNFLQDFQRMEHITTLWNEVCKLEEEPFNQIKFLYDDRTFPIEFRHCFCHMIEHENWDKIDPDDPHHEGAARGKVIKKD